jgi:hypothetical protein
MTQIVHLGWLRSNQLCSKYCLHKTCAPGDKHIAATVNLGGKIYIIGQILDESLRLEAVGFNLTFYKRIGCGRVLRGKGIPRLVK